MTDKQNAYDQIPYTSNPFAQTHPDRLATIATLLGMYPAPVENCRVLELGCAGGGNLVPMACSLPQSRFVGIDLSARQIADGQAMAQAAGVQNVTLSHMDIMEVEADFGQFDYIIAHGVYSWVPPQVQDKLLAICRQNLAPNGVAYISYNTYPGWRLHSAVRDMMLYHTRQIAEPGERIDQAHDLLDFLAGSILADSTPHANFLHSYVHYVKERFLPEGDTAYLLHNELAEVNEPLYFYQFAERAAKHGLRYLAEAQFRTMLVDSLPPEAAANLRRLAKNTVELEQYMDFLRNRTFRQTLLCHQEVALKGRLSPERLADFYVASAALPEKPDLDPQSGSVDRFCAPNGDTLTTDHPVTKAAMLHLSQVWPQAVPFNELFTAACTRLNGQSPVKTTKPGVVGDDQILGNNLLKAYSHNDDLVEFHVYTPPFRQQISDLPIASPLARFQVKNGAATVTNLRHEIIKIVGLGHYLLPYLDGSWSHVALAELLETLINEGTVEMQPEEQPLSPGATAQIKERLPEMVESALQTLANAALLIG